MQIRLFTLPLNADTAQQEEMNHFLRSVRVVEIRKELAMQNGNSCWTFCITYMQDGTITTSSPAKGGQRVDYKEVLDETSFRRFSAMRKVRKVIAENDAVPAYTIFTDAEMAELAKMPQLTLQTMQTVQGVGKRKIEKYGQLFIDKLQEEGYETGEPSDGADSLA